MRVKENIKGRTWSGESLWIFAVKRNKERRQKLEGEGSSRKSLERREKFQYVLVDSIQEREGNNDAGERGRIIEEQNQARRRRAITQVAGRASVRSRDSYCRKGQSQ